MYKPIAQRIEDINNTPQLTGVSKVMSPSIKKYKPISKRDENKSIALNLSKPDITETTNRDFSSPTFSFSVPQTTAQTTEQFREGGSFVEDIPSFAKAVGQSIGNSVLSVAIDMHNNARPDKYIDKIDITGTTFWDEFSRRITGKTELKSLADQVIDTEQEIKKWKKEVQLGLDSGNLTPVESASAKAFLSFKPEILAFAGVVGSTGLDLTPFGGIEKNLYKTIAKTALKGSEETALTLLKRVGVADDLALQGAKDMVLFVKDEKSAKKFFENIVKLQTETKSSKPLQGYISVKKRDSYISPQNIKINDSKIFDTASNIAKSKNPKEIYELLIKLGIDKDVSLNLTPKLVNQKDEKFIYSLLEKTKKDNISFKPRTLDTGQESAVLDELSKTDTKPLHITGNVDYLHKFSDVSSPEQMRLEELKIKAENKNLTKAEIVEADVLLRKRNIDAIKIADERLKTVSSQTKAIVKDGKKAVTEQPRDTIGRFDVKPKTTLSEELMAKISKPKPVVPVYEGEKDLTVKTLEKLKGRSTVSKQFISDLTNSADLKQSERDLIRKALANEGDTVNVTDFAEKVKDDLLPLKTQDQALNFEQKSKELKKMGYSLEQNMDGSSSILKNGDEVEYDDLPTNIRKLYDEMVGGADEYEDLRGKRYESVTLPDELRGSVKNYKENIYQSPIKTSAGSVHFGNTENYFGHTRIEDMADNKTRRVIEVQSDLYQKGNLDNEMATPLYDKNHILYSENQKYGNVGGNDFKVVDLKKRNAEVAKLQQYNDPTAHFRMIREEVKKAAQDGKTKLQFPTGETAMKIEGLGQSENLRWRTAGNGHILKSEELKVGSKISSNGQTDWIITDVLGDGKFKAVPKRMYDDANVAGGGGMDRIVDAHRGQTLRSFEETFDISGKVDTNNPIYKFYEKEVGRYLANKYKAKLVTDAQGVKWWEVDINLAMGKAPVEAFGAVAGVKIDENGNVTFDPLKAVIGVAGFTAYKGMGKSKIPQAIYKDLSSISKAIKGKFISALKLDEIKTAIAITEDAVENMPGKNLMKYVSKTTGELPEVTGEATMKSLTGSGKTVKRSTFGQKGDDIVTEFGFKDLDDAREGLNAYRNSKGYLEALKVQAKQLVVERSAIRKGERLMEMAMGDRRMAYRAVRDRFGLSETDLAKIRRGRDIMSMEPKEFQDFMARAENMGAEIEKLREAKVKMFGTVNALDLHKWENVREVMKFPNISKMNVEQFNKLDEILSQYKTGDEFLPVRQLETINTTELKGIRTTREARDFLAKKFNIKPKDLPGIKPHPWMYDTQLARQHPLYDLLVTKYNESYLKATGRAIELERKADDLIKKARSSSKTTLGDYIAPTDKQIISWLESTDRVSLEKTMTLEQIQAAEYMDGVYKEYYDWLSKRALDKKFSSRFEDKYFPHVRRGFLETWKEDGFLQGVKQSFDQFKNEERMLTILDEKTGNILPYQKWIGFTQFRGEGLVPTQNASRAFKAYVTALEKARQFDEFIPEIMVYVHSLTPKGLTQRGVELDDSLNRFVKSWINSKKGRVQKQIITPGGKADWVLRMGVALTRIRDLGLNIPVGIANIFGEQAGNLTMLGAKNFTLGLGRFATKKGREITKKYANFVGKSIFESLAEASNTIGDKLLGGVFGVFSVSSRKANQVFLLGSMTADEFAKGTISLERLAQLRKNMGKYRVVEDSESIFGKSVEGAIGGQYKRWAIPIITSTASNAKILSKMLLTKSLKEVLSSKEGSELFYSVILGFALGLGIMGYYNELSENKDRTFVEDIIFKSSRDSLSMIGALDPKFIGSFSAPRLSSLIIDLTTGLDHLIMLEKYKTTGELKGVSELKKALTPSLLTTLTKENNKTISGASKSQSSRKIKIPKGLPEIPELKSTLPKLPKLPMLP